MFCYGGYISRKKFNNIKGFYFFLTIGLIGLFLGKRNNAPFGFIYEFLYKYLPGFNMYRGDKVLPFNSFSFFFFCPDYLFFS